MRDGDLTPMAEGATAAHELMVSYVRAGFTRKEAVGMVTAMLVEAVRTGQGK
jgi:hypothetical protein